MEYWILNIVNIDYWIEHWGYIGGGLREAQGSQQSQSLVHRPFRSSWAFIVPPISIHLPSALSIQLMLAGTQWVGEESMSLLCSWFIWPCKLYLSDNVKCICRIVQIVFPPGIAQYVECWSCIAPSKSTLHHVGDEWMWLFIQGVELVGPLFRDFRETFFKLKWGGEEEFLDKETFYILKRLCSGFGILSEQM